MKPSYCQVLGVLLTAGVVTVSCGGTKKGSESGESDGSADPQGSSTAASSNKPATQEPANNACSTKEPCKAKEVCCRAQNEGPAVEYCAPMPPGADNPLQACSEKLPAKLKQSTLSVSYTALVCADSGDCPAEQICVLGAPYSSDSLAASCMEKKDAFGFAELCGRGTCKLGKTQCEAAAGEDWSDVRSCEPTSAIQCGKASCAKPQVCCNKEKGPVCTAESECADLSAGARWGCTSTKECGEGQVCCVTGGGQMGSVCSFSCDYSMQLPTCTKDSECPEIMGSKSKCKPADTSPNKGLKICTPG
ncbi:MAG: hypothetical protein U0271_36895 [Polyangiaceae bacterium]